MRTFNKTAQLLTVTLAAALGLSFAAQTQAAASATQVIEKTKSDYAKTKYPILMVHGWLGWSRIGTDSIGLDYWYQILPDMARNGSTVFAAQLSPANTTMHRRYSMLQRPNRSISLRLPAWQAPTTVPKSQMISRTIA